MPPRLKSSLSQLRPWNLHLYQLLVGSGKDSVQAPWTWKCTCSQRSFICVWCPTSPPYARPIYVPPPQRGHSHYVPMLSLELNAISHAISPFVAGPAPPRCPAPSNAQNAKCPVHPKCPAPPRMPQILSMPQMPRIPQMPSMAQMPSVPQMPSASQMPSTPQMPSTSQMPSVPQTASTPQMPSMNMPSTPHIPSVPYMPHVPQMPSTPKMPSTFLQSLQWVFNKYLD